MIYKSCVQVVAKPTSRDQLTLLQNILDALGIDYEKTGWHWHPGTVVCTHCGEPDSYHDYIDNEFICRKE